MHRVQGVDPSFDETKSGIHSAINLAFLSLVMLLSFGVTIFCYSKMISIVLAGSSTLLKLQNNSLETRRRLKYKIYFQITLAAIALALIIADVLIFGNEVFSPSLSVVLGYIMLHLLEFTKQKIERHDPGLDLRGTDIISEVS